MMFTRTRLCRRRTVRPAMTTATGLVNELDLVHLLRPAHGLAMRLRRSALRTTAGPALPNP
jgi:hypothetical protein